VVFGSASATITHPYYLVGLTIPLAAVLGIALALLWRAFHSGNVLSWFLPGTIVGVVAYQATKSRELVGEWAMAVLLVVTPLAVLGMAVAIWRRATATALATAFVAMGALSVLLLPTASTLVAGGPMAGPSASLARLPVPLNLEQDRVYRVLSYIRSQGYARSDFALGALSAHQAAPFIISGVPAVAIGGFSGRDPIFTLDSFRSMVERGQMRYFLMPDQSGPGTASGGPGRSPQQSILEYIRRDWEDVSRLASLPPGTLYRYLFR
jgi:4-amino-4-deoxy-L-arabinose transferase-like glycosyltransferase